MKYGCIYVHRYHYVRMFNIFDVICSGPNAVATIGNTCSLPINKSCSVSLHTIFM